MRLLLKLSITIFIIMVVGSCTNEIGEEALFITEAPVQSATVISNADKSVTFNTRIVWFTNCGKYHHFEMDSTGRTVFVQAFGSQLINAYCDETLSVFSGEFTINTDSSGEYLFRFWVNDDVTKDYTVIVND